MNFIKKTITWGFMHKRASERFPANVDVKFFCGNMFYSGIVTNFSQHGMFIRTMQCLPFESKFEIFFHVNEEILKVPVKVSRIEKTEGFYDGMGVNLLKHPQKYLEYLDHLKSTSPSL